MPETDDDEPAKGERVTNSAADNAKVDAQFGYVEGDAVYHKHETIYQVSHDDSPEKKFKVACSNLRGGIPRVAENLISQVLDAHHATTEIAYYYAISVLSERSLSQLGSPELDKLDRALRIAASLPYDQWRAAIDVIGKLLKCVIPATVTNEPQTDALQIVFADLEAIALPRRAEILQHLNMIFDAATQDKVDQLNAETVAAERTGNNRSDRAWKFFHPEPEAPRRAAPTPHDGGSRSPAPGSPRCSGAAGSWRCRCWVSRANCCCRRVCSCSAACWPGGPSRTSCVCVSGGR
ncbi:hypothetical protein GCM10029964_065690 [Kibdelosporangium lantanae]